MAECADSLHEIICTPLFCLYIGYIALIKRGSGRRSVGRQCTQVYKNGYSPCSVLVPVPYLEPLQQFYVMLFWHSLEF
jgi:hypothetical protein